MSPIGTPVTMSALQPIYDGRVVPCAPTGPIAPGTFVVLTGTNTQAGEMQVTTCGLGVTPFGVTVTGISETQWLTRDPTSVELRIQVVRKPTIARVVPGAAFAAAGVAVQSDELGRAIPAGAPTLAYLQTGVVANDNALTWTAVSTGTGGNSISIAITAGSASTATTTAAASGNAITVTTSTDANSNITATAAQVIAAVLASTAVSALVTVENTGESDGSGVVTALSTTDLAHGASTGGTAGGSMVSTSTCNANDPFVGVAL